MLNQSNIDKYRAIVNLKSKKVSKNFFRDEYILGVRVRSFNESSNKCIVYLHGGGFVSGSVETYADTCLKISKFLDCKVIAIDYSLAPEYRFPYQIDEVCMVLKELYKSNKDITLMGDSAGATISLFVALKLKRDKFIKSIVLIYPSSQTDYSKTSKFKSLFLNNKGLLTREILEDYMSLYLNKTSYKKASLLKGKFYFGIPRVLIITGSNDLLHDEGICLVNVLKRHFVKVTHYDLVGASHGFFNSLLDNKYKLKTLELIKGWI